MPYPQGGLIMAENLQYLIDQRPDLPKEKFYMFWNGILTFHFPDRLNYVVGLRASTTGSSSKPEFCTVLQGGENVVLVLGFKKPADNTPAGKEEIVEELASFIKECFDETKFSTIYAIGGIGLSVAAYKMEKSGPPKLQLVFDWTSDVTSEEFYGNMVQLTSMVDEMTGTIRKK
ncbi:hypothetical protein EDC04DRAFT_2649449 [Pisolithus marmoratus]|nr:hypothetical protein EDC04DRAFT_2649449 [Pisolithus marmoratus]